MMEQLGSKCACFSHAGTHDKSQFLGLNTARQKKVMYFYWKLHVPFVIELKVWIQCHYQCRYTKERAQYEIVLNTFLVYNSPNSDLWV